MNASFVRASVRRRAGIAGFACAAVVGALFYAMPPAGASTITSATITGGSGTVSVGGTVYAKQGGALTLTVITSSDTKCLDITGAFTANQTSSTAKTSWTFPFTAPAGDGSQAVTASASPGFNGNNACTGAKGTAAASYVLDNTGPTVTGALAPAPNGAGWNKSNVSITWSATDGSGSGVASGPTPASENQTTNGTSSHTATATDRLGNVGTGSVTVHLDKSAPTIVGSRSPSANGFGWNNTGVIVNFNCTDSPSSDNSGVLSCSGPTTLGSDGANQSVTGTSTDTAGNTASTTVSGINIDRTSPTLTGTPATSPNGNGWYRNDVTVHWNASDATSGVDPATLPGDSTISSEGSALTAAASVADKAGNVTSATSTPVKIDKTAPVTGISGVSNDWTNSNVTVTLSPSDALSGVASTTYQVDGGAAQTGATFTLSAEGTHTVTYSSTDNAGNAETLRSATIKIDKTAPTISHAFTPPDYADGAWTNAATVTVTFNCADTGSGVASCTAPASVSTQGAAQHVTGSAKDNAGNSASDTATVSIDRSAPTISGAADRAPNGNGWYADDVSVSFTCTDQANLSGIQSCAPSKTLGEGKNQSVTGTATDVAGNSSTTSVTGINVDKTAPSLTGAPTTSPNGNGWYDNSVFVTWTCSDPLSGIDGACPAGSTVTGEGGNLSATASVSDKAGNTKSSVVAGLRIDTTAPVTLGSVNAPLATGWYAGKAHVTLDGEDSLSGVDTTYYDIDGGATKTYTGPFDVTAGGQHTVTFWSTDEAGNVEDATGPGHTLNVKIDDVKPNISGIRTPVANAAGWNNTPVDVNFTCSDGESGVASCAGDTTLTADGANQYATGTAVDNAGNSDTSVVGPINVDRTAPDISGTATSPPNAYGWYDGDVTVQWTASDATSGVDGSTVPTDTVVDGEGNDLTAGPVTVKDLAGNTGEASVQHIKIDRTGPTLTGAALEPANGNGWYRDDVTIAWNCDDALSGIVPGACPADSLITGEGGALSATASVNDRAGNGSSTTVDGIRIDRTAPSTDISAPSGWRNSDATVTLSADDNLSGVAATHYTINGGPTQTGTTISFSDEGIYDLEAWSVDKAGNVEAHKSAEVLIDKTAPTIKHTQVPSANADGWNNTDVTISFTCNDTGGSGVASCSDPITETEEGKGQPEPGTVTDNAGNSATDPATVSIDKSKPTIDGAPDRAANGAGWYDGDVTVTFSCGDQLGLSGVKSCSAPVTLGEGADQSATGTVTDAAGNGDTDTVSGIDVDETAPLLAGKATTAANGAGWYDGDVTVHWTCSDALSGIAAGGCPDDSTITGEGPNLGATASVSDKAGNGATAGVGGVHIDRTPPITTATLPAADSTNGWYATGPTVALTATDGLSGVDETWYRIDGGAAQQYAGPFVEGLEGEHTVTFWSTDAAGNAESAAGANNGVVIRVDTTKPTITGSRQPAANAAGWNNEPVTVSFSCADGGSGIGSCPNPTTVGNQGADQSVTGTATDMVGNANSATVGGIKIDLTSPTLTGATTSAPNADGWYKGDVGVHWTCGDDLSGVAGSCPADSTVTGEGANLSASTSIADKAGNARAATVDGIKIDRHGPETTVSAPSDWQTTGVVLDVTANDNLSGVKATYFTVNGGPTQSGNKVSLNDDGTYSLAFWSVDKAGNEGVHGTASVKIDQTAPTITHNVKPDPNGDGWNNSDATVHFLCDDVTSGVKSCTPDQVVTTQAADQKVIGAAVDNAGNSSSDTATINLDKTKPTITGKADRAANAAGWYDANVTVNFTCADGLSGVAHCADDQVVSEGANQSVSGTVYDKAGNVETTVVSGLNVDETAPTLSGTATTSPNAQGWYSGNVTVHWTCSDALSGVVGCPADTVISGDGDNLSSTAAVTDKAGNQTTRTVGGIKIDRTAPVTTASAPDPTFASGWYAAPVTVTLAAVDGLSGVDVTHYSIDSGQATVYDHPFTVGKGVHVVTFWSRDAAGNVEDKTTGGHSLTLKVDDLAPAISGAPTASANANGWYNGPVTVHFTCSDAETAVDSCGPDKTLGSEGANQSVTGTAKDLAGNTATATVGPINVDLTPPTFAAYTGPTSFTAGQTVTAPSCGASDALSGLAGCTVAKSGSGFGNAKGVGDFTYTFTATDKAGNSATQSVTLHVGYKWSGFLQPVTNTAHDLGTASAFKAGSTVPVKFQLKDAGGAVLQATYMPVWLQPVDGGTTSTTATAVSNTSPATVGGSFKWDATAQQYVFTWQTPKSGAGHYYRIGVQLDSGDTYTTLIVLQ